MDRMDGMENLDEHTAAIIGIAYEVMNEVGCGFREKAYERAMIREFQFRSIPCDQQKSFTLFYKDTAIDTLIRISFANNTSLRSAFSGPVLLAHSHRSTLCLDENQPAWGFDSTFRVGGSVQPPKVKKRVEPHFPDSAIEAMGAGRNVFVLVESVISSTGCVRSMRILEQSPFPAMNGAALMALSQWTFTPGAVDGKPVDVIFNMLFNFKTR